MSEEVCFKGPACPAHNVFEFANGVKFVSTFDNGNLAHAMQGNKRDEYKIWTSPDCAGTPMENTKPNAWYYFMVSGVKEGTQLKIQVVNGSNHSGLYKHDMRPVFKCNATKNKWTRLKNSVRWVKGSREEGLDPTINFEHSVELGGDKIYFAFTYPYTYTMVQEDLAAMDDHVNNLNDPNAMYWTRELLTKTRDGLRLDLLTITNSNGHAPPSSGAESVENNDPTLPREPLIPKLFPDAENVFLDKSGVASYSTSRPVLFPEKEILYISARVHPGEVPAQHTLKGILNLLLDPKDHIANALRNRFVIKVVPMLNPDGVYRGHFRLDQFGQNLNRYYSNPCIDEQTPIYAVKQCLDYMSETRQLTMYLDLHAHASKRGCFIYGNVMDNKEDQVQNMLYCRLIALNTPNFDYEGCLFSREHMQRIDPGDRNAGLTAEGSGRVANYLHHGIIHSYTLECNYNCSKSGNEVPPTEMDTTGAPHNQQGASAFTTYPDKFTPSIWWSVGRACVTAMLDIRSINPCSRLPRSKHKTLGRYRQAVLQEVKQRKEYKEKINPGGRFLQGSGSSGGAKSQSEDVTLWRPRISEKEGEETNVRTYSTADKFPITNAPLLKPSQSSGSLKKMRSDATGSTSTSSMKAMAPVLEGGFARPHAPMNHDEPPAVRHGMGGVGVRRNSSSNAAEGGTSSDGMGHMPSEVLHSKSAGTDGRTTGVNPRRDTHATELAADLDEMEASIAPIEEPPKAYFPSSGGGRNSANYVRGATPGACNVPGAEGQAKREISSSTPRSQMTQSQQQHQAQASAGNNVRRQLHVQQVHRKSLEQQISGNPSEGSMRRSKLSASLLKQTKPRVGDRARLNLTSKSDLNGMSLEQMNAMSLSGQEKGAGAQPPLFSALPVRLIPKVAPSGNMSSPGKFQSNIPKMKSSRSSGPQRKQTLSPLRSMF